MYLKDYWSTIYKNTKVSKILDSLVWGCNCDMWHWKSRTTKLTPNIYIFKRTLIINYQCFFFPYIIQVFFPFFIHMSNRCFWLRGIPWWPRNKEVTIGMCSSSMKVWVTWSRWWWTIFIIRIFWTVTKH